MSLTGKENIHAIAHRLGLPPEGSVDDWRRAVIRVAKSEAFIFVTPSYMHIRREDWQRWRELEESPRKMLDLLRKLVYGVRIWD